MATKHQIPSHSCETKRNNPNPEHPLCTQVASASTLLSIVGARTSCETNLLVISASGHAMPFVHELRQSQLSRLAWKTNECCENDGKPRKSATDTPLRQKSRSHESAASEVRGSKQSLIQNISSQIVPLDELCMSIHAALIASTHMQVCL